MKQKLVDGWEFDWCSRAWRSVTSWKPGQGKYIKRKMNKRLRKEGRKDIEQSCL